MNLVMSVEEAAEALSISRTLCYQAIHRQEIPSIRLGNRILVPRFALEQMLATKRSDLAVTGPLPEPEIPVTKKGVGCASD
jgi:excisionase family DNA binding protein